MGKKKTFFATDKDGNLFVELKAVMNPMCALIDGIPLVGFGKSKKLYIAIDTAIEWCQKEMQHHSREKYQKMIDVMLKCKEQEAAGKEQKVEP